MKKIIIISILAFALFETSCSYSQQMVQTKADLKKLNINKQQFIGKPLKILLKEIKPEIKMAIGHPSDSETPGYLKLYFIDADEYNKYAMRNKKPLGIAIRFGGDFNWDIRQKPKDKRFIWTKDDEKRYGDSNVIDLDVTGEN